MVKERLSSSVAFGRAIAPLLSIQRLSRRIQSGWIWQDIDFEVWAGDRIAVVGPSGGGKSLLLRAIAGLDSVQAGQIVFDGKPLTQWFLPRYRTQVLYLHQRPALLEGTVEMNLRSVYQFAAHQDKTYDRQPILNDLKQFGRTDAFLERPIAALSGGEAQIVAFLRALQLAPDVLLLDEPTASLDAETATQLEALVERWHATNPHRAYLWVSHDPQQVARISDRQIYLGKP
ncbi:ABC transporter ATP-binding protein [Myxacorys almedinensis]|uniref:ATP-binding cassette domain-containing protein n=1 Tax=Myxacorys almedinensis A TaxID=2690445 RepID=A0A8J7Z062_9CYAN|nr:ATP-binding cassette domain-containing protein [Myxacorys almedinensis]NDJ17289.1 ATP-binding cassette domain-containing protein [Myxacorys almedinensis A]